MPDAMDDKDRRAALMSAMTTEHVVMQSVIGVTISESGQRASIYMISLSSSLVAMGFVAQSPGAFVPFVATVLPAVFVLGIFTIMRIVDIAAENLLAHIGIARIRAYYRTINAEAAEYFAAERGRWPELAASEPSMRAGPLIGYLTTVATMIAAINAMVAAAGVALLLYHLMELAAASAVLAGIAFAAIFLVIFYRYQRSRTTGLVGDTPTPNSSGS